MKLTDKLVDEMIADMFGQELVPLVDLLKKEDNISEFKLADKLKLNINIVRNMLYKLNGSNFVFFTRKKDKQKGWYIYFWTLNRKHIMHLLYDYKKNKVQRLRLWLERENTSNFFVCPNECMRLNYEDALDSQFKCPECESIMSQEVASKDKIKFIKSEIERLEQEVTEEAVLIDKELDIERKKEQLIEKKKAEEEARLAAKKLHESQLKSLEKKRIAQEKSAKERAKREIIAKKKALIKKKLMEKKLVAKKKLMEKKKILAIKMALKKQKLEEAKKKLLAKKMIQNKLVHKSAIKKIEKKKIEPKSVKKPEIKKPIKKKQSPKKPHKEKKGIKLEESPVVIEKKELQPRSISDIPIRRPPSILKRLFRGSKRLI